MFALQEDLVTDLIKASSLRLREVAAVWVPVVVTDGTEIDVDTTAVLLPRIAELARAAAGTEGRLYCWIAC